MDAVLFDLDGTLVDSAQLTASSLIAAVSAAGEELTTLQLAGHTGGPLRDWLGSRLNLAPARIEDVYRDYVERIKAHAGEMTALDGADALLLRLHWARVPLALVTTRLLEIALPIVEARGWSHLFAVVVGQDSVALPKPAADPALFALDALCVTPAGAVFVGDTEADIACALAAGIGTVIGLAGTRPAEALSAAGAIHVCPSLRAVEELLFDAPTAG